MLTSPADTGAVFLALPQDLQTFAFDYPVELFAPRVWPIAASRADRDAAGSGPRRGSATPSAR